MAERTGSPSEPTTVTRRTVLTVGLAGLVSVTAGGSVLFALADRALAGGVNISLSINPGVRIMIDGTTLFIVGFGSAPGQVDLPGGVIEVEAGDTVTVDITNNDDQAHNFSIAGVVTSGAVAPGSTSQVTFTAPAVGTYFYTSTQQGVVGRALGLYGAFNVYPPGNRPGPGTRSLPLAIPADVAAAVQQRYPDGLRIAREYTWLLSEMDPRVNGAAEAGAATTVGTYEPDFFFINGLSGVLACEDPHTVLRGRVGDRTLLRMVNVGLLPRSIHMHGNHFIVLTHPDQPWVLGSEKDVVRIPPGGVVDVLVPFVAPPDAWPPVLRGQQYVVHDHIEMSNTANGGLYPAGMISELEFL